MILFNQTSLNGRRAACIRAKASRLAVSAGALLLAAAPLLATAAQPGERNAVALGDDAPAKVVRYGDLNLTTDGGARVLLERIQLAADTVCPAADNRDLGRFMAHRRCVRLAIAQAVQQVGNARVAAVYWAHAEHG